MTTYVMLANWTDQGIIASSSGYGKESAQGHGR